MRAAAVSDWKRACEEYGKALQKEPNAPELRAKYEHAKAQAYEQSISRTQRFLEEHDYEAARTEADYAVQLREEDPTALALRAKVRVGLALDTLQQARATAERGNVNVAFDLLERAQNLPADAAVRADIASTEPIVVSAALRKWPPSEGRYPLSATEVPTTNGSPCSWSG